MSRAGTATDRLQRLLALVPYVVSRQVVGLAETASAFGVTEHDLVDDLNMLWCVELRSPDPYCPIDLSYEGGEIMVTQAESMGRPLRLGTDEASALLIGLRLLAELPGQQDSSALRRTIAKLEAAAGEAAAASAQVAVQMDGRAPADVQADVADALRDAASGCTCLTTCPAGTRRPSGTWTRCGSSFEQGRAYLEGWCRRAERGAAVPAGPGARPDDPRRGRRGSRHRRARGRGFRAVPAVRRGHPGRTRTRRGRSLGRRLLPVREGDRSRRRTAQRGAQDAGHADGSGGWRFGLARTAR